MKTVDVKAKESSIEDKISKIDIKAIRIPNRTAKEWKNAIHWEITLNDVEVEYSEGIGHFVKSNIGQAVLGKHLEKALLEDSGISTVWKEKEIKDKLTDRVVLKGKVFSSFKYTIKPPDIKYILHSLSLDADAINYTFEDWADNFGMDTDSIKAKAMFEECRDSYTKIRTLGFTLAELLEYFQDY